MGSANKDEINKKIDYAKIAFSTVADRQMSSSSVLKMRATFDWLDIQHFPVVKWFQIVINKSLKTLFQIQFSIKYL